MGNATGRFSISPRSGSFSRQKTPKRLKLKNDKELLAAPFTNNCNSLDTPTPLNECESLRRLIMVLNWYNMNMSIDKLLIEYVDTYTNLLNDYHHVLSKHLNQKKVRNDENFLFIYNKLSKHIQCDVRTCKQYTRLDIPNRLSRISNANIDELQTMIDQNTEKHHIVHFYKELLDVLHCYFMHSYDLGLRVSTFEDNINDKEEDDDKEEEEEEGIKLLEQDIIGRKDESLIDLEHKEEDTERLHNDEEMRGLEKLLRKKRDTFKIMRGLSLNENSKFFADISIKYDNKDTMNIDEYKYEYHFGYRCYYWPFYKDNENEDVFWNPGKRYKDLYIQQKYSNLKEEVMENKIFRVQINDYDRTYEKATHYLSKSYIVKQMRSSTLSYGNCHYNINNNAVLLIEHIMSIMLYTDHQHLAQEFARSFRKNNVNQSDKEYKKQKGEYANWTRFIRETVELYGTTMEDNQIKSFYFGISSQIIFNRFREKICSPVSTSPQLSVIMMFGQKDNGIILDLGQSSQPGNKLKCFNCSLFSCYGEEDERLFIGGYAPIQINSIRIVKTHKNYERFLVSLGYFDTILNGAYDIKNKCCGSDFEIIKSLICELREDVTVLNDEEDEVKEECDVMRFPLYISKMFREFVVRKESIYIDLQGLHWHYKAFISLLISADCNNLVRFSFIVALFNECDNITVKMLMYDSVSSSYIGHFLQDIDRINSLKSKHKLKTIKLEMFRINVNQTKWKEFEVAMNALNCSLELTGRGNEGYKQLIVRFNQ